MGVIEPKLRIPEFNTKKSQNFHTSNAIFPILFYCINNLQREFLRRTGPWPEMIEFYSSNLNNAYR